jgi:hypothetical protein
MGTSLGMRIPLAMVTFVAAYQMSIAVPRASQAGRQQDSLIDALTSAPALVAYVEDGAAWMSVLDGSSATVKAIVSLGAEAIPLLISHLDDTRLTSATFDGGVTRGRPIRVPVGYLCLDILLEIVDDRAPVFIKDCADDGLGACIEPDYYFRPDEYYPGAWKEYRAREGVRVVKRSWERAYRSKLLHFRSPVRWAKVPVRSSARRLHHRGDRAGILLPADRHPDGRRETCAPKSTGSTCGLTGRCTRRRLV